MGLYGNQIVVKPRNKTEVSKSLIIYSDTGLGKSNLFKNAPNCLYLNLENRLGHIEGTLKEERITDIKIFRDTIGNISKEYGRIQKIKTAKAEKDEEALKRYKTVLKAEYEEYENCAMGKIPYIQLLVVDSTDDIYSMLEGEVKTEMKIDDLADADRNRAYGRAKNKLLKEIRSCMNVGITVVFLCGIVKAKEAWNTEDKDIPFVGSGSAYKAMSRKVTGAFAVDEESDGNRYIYTNPKNKRFFIKNSFDDIDAGKKLPDKIPLDFSELNKWVNFYTKEELDTWKKAHNLKKL